MVPVVAAPVAPTAFGLLNAFQVAWSTTPLAVSLLLVWNAFTAAVVPAPKLPSTVTS